MKQRGLVFWSWLNHWPWKRRGAAGEQWTRERFELWKRTALTSLQSQTVTDWRYALICSPAQEGLTRALRSEIDDSRVTIVHGGEERAWRSRLPSARLYVVARLDSDDRYHPKAGALLMRQAFGKDDRWLKFKNGYAWDQAEEKLYDWVQSSSPFYAHVVNGTDYQRSARVPRPRHTEPMLSRARGMAPGHFIVTLHSGNTSTNLRTGALGREIQGERRLAVVEAFGLMR